MHEQSLMRDLMNKIHQLIEQENKPLVGVTLQVGELAHISSTHLREHFEHEIEGTPIQGVRLYIEEVMGFSHPQAQDIVLKSLEFEDIKPTQTADDNRRQIK